jgi:hypothetical protein
VTVSAPIIAMLSTAPSSAFSTRKNIVMPTRNSSTNSSRKLNAHEKKACDAGSGSGTKSGRNRKKKPSKRPKGKKKTSSGNETQSPIRRRGLGPPIPIGTALRENGRDEHTIAQSYLHVVDKLKQPNAEAGSAQKLLVDILKECSRQVESAQQAGLAPSADRPVVVQLVHTVARPARVLPAHPKLEDDAASLLSP